MEDRGGGEFSTQKEWQQGTLDPKYMQIIGDPCLGQTKYDPVTRPEHYNKNGIECIQAIEASMTKEEFEGYLKGNVLKYLWRYKYKNLLEDLRKANWYLNKLMSVFITKIAKETQGVKA